MPSDKVLNTPDKQVLALRAVEDFRASIGYAAFMEKVNWERDAAVRTLTGVTAGEQFDPNQVLQKAAVVQTLDRVCGWFDQIEKEGKEASKRD